jgi:hypothetical protein
MKLRISNEHYLQALLERFEPQGCHPVRTPLPPGFRPVPSTNEEHRLARRLPYPQVVGSILYSSKGTRHDLVHPAGVLSPSTSVSLSMATAESGSSLRYGEEDWSPSAAMLCYSTAILGPRRALLLSAAGPSLPRRLLPSTATLPTPSV